MHGLALRTTPAWVLGATLYRKFFLQQTRVVAVAGSFGKTTTTRCLLALLTGEFNRNQGGNRGIPAARNILRIRPRDRFAVIETAVSDFGHMAQNARLIQPDIAVVMCVGSEHNLTFQTLEATRNEKADVLRALGKKGLAVLNGDDPHVRWMSGQTDADVVTFGCGRENDYRASDISLEWPSGTRLTLHTPRETHRLFSPLFGKHMTYPVTAAAAVADRLGLDLSACLPNLTKIEPVPGRLNPLSLASGAIVLRDDFKSTTETIHSALDFLEEIPGRRKIVALGEVSEAPGSKGPIYRRIGKRIGQTAAKAFFICSTKSFSLYANGAVSAGMAKKNLYNAGTDGLTDLIDILRSELRAGDVLLVKGRGNQRLGRLAFALQGRAVGCRLSACDAASTLCDRCPMLASGWSGRKIVF